MKRRVISLDGETWRQSGSSVQPYLVRGAEDHLRGCDVMSTLRALSETRNDEDFFGNGWIAPRTRVLGRKILMDGRLRQ